MLFLYGASYNAIGDEMKRMVIVLLSLLLLLCGCTAHSEPPQQVTAEEKIESPCYVALTFDDGPSAKYTPPLLDGLKERGVHATFFLIGSLTEENEELVRRMKAEGHQIGNHSYDHAKLTEMTCATALADIARGDEALRKAIRAERETLSPSEVSAIVDALTWQKEKI